MIRPEDDDRTFWLFTLVECGHLVGVLTDHGYARSRAWLEMYDDQPGIDRAIARGVQARHIGASTYHAIPIEAFSKGCTC